MNKEQKLWLTSRKKEKVSMWSLFTLFLGFLMLLKNIMTLILNYITYTDDCYQWLPITKRKLAQYNFSSMNHIITKSQITIESELHNICCTDWYQWLPITKKVFADYHFIFNQLSFLISFKWLEDNISETFWEERFNFFI